MNHYLKLVNFEVKRFWKLFIGLITFVIVAQLIGAIITARNYMKYANENMRREQMIESEYVLNYGAYSLQRFIYSEYFVLSVVFAAAVLIIYVFFIWYRDWLGKSSFIYRLLMLPTARRNVYFAKLTTILLFVLFLVGLQILLFSGVGQISRLIVPEQLRNDYGIVNLHSYDFLAVLYPQTPLYFVLLYGLGMTVVAIVFTAILFERSYQLKGIFFGAIYLILSFVFISIPVIFQIMTSYLYMNEIILLMVLTSSIALALAIYLADYLLKQKINV